MIASEIRRAADASMRAAREAVAVRKGSCERVAVDFVALTAELHQREDQETFLRQCSDLIDEAARQARVSTAEAFQELMTSALQAIFGPDYAFHMELVTSRNRPAAKLHVTGGGYDEPAEPKDSRGGGLVDMLALAARIVVANLLQPMPRGAPLILDEPVDALDDQRSPAAASFLAQVCSMTGRQIIIVTHDRRLAQSADLVIDLEVA